MIHRTKRFFIEKKRFRNEFRRQIRLLLIITLGFTIAFTWRQTVFDASQAFVKFITHIQNPTASSTITSIFITLVCVALIYLLSYILRDSPENY